MYFNTLSRFALYSQTITNNEPLLLFSTGPPLIPTEFKVINSTCISATLGWIPGFNGGSLQTFTITYVNTDSGEEYSVGPIPEDTSQNKMVYKLMDGITAESHYEFSITTTNSYGESPGDDIEHTVPGTYNKWFVCNLH